MPDFDKSQRRDGPTSPSTPRTTFYIFLEGKPLVQYRQNFSKTRSGITTESTRLYQGGAKDSRARLSTN